MSDQPRPPFDTIVKNRALAFCRGLLEEVPELEGLAVVPSYSNPHPNVPFGFVVGRHGPLRTPDELMHIALQLHSTLNTVMQNIFDVIQSCDRKMGEMAAEIKALDEAKRAVTVATDLIQSCDREMTEIAAEIAEAEAYAAEVEDINAPGT